MIATKRSMSISIGVGLLLYHSCTGRPDPQDNDGLTVPTLFFKSNTELGERGGQNQIIMSHKFVQFKDFEYLTEGKSTPTDIKVVVYVKVIDDKDGYLGSLRFGLYQDLIEATMKECISDIVSQNYPTYKAYESEITKI